MTKAEIEKKIKAYEHEISNSKQSVNDKLKNITNMENSIDKLKEMLENAETNDAKLDKARKDYAVAELNYYLALGILTDDDAAKYVETRLKKITEGEKFLTAMVDLFR